VLQLKEAERLGARPQHKLHAARAHDHAHAMVKELRDVGDLNARDMVGIGLRPVPSPAAARPELHVLAAAKPLNVQDAPFDVLDLR